MSKQIGILDSFTGGIADSLKIGQKNSFAWARSIDFRTNPSQFTINPKSIRQTGLLITDLPLWGDIACDQLYFYGNTGNLYEKTSADVWSLGTTVPDSQGNGMVYFPEDSYLYYASNTSIGRRSSACSSTGTYYNSFLETEGGEPTNTQSILFASASSQYASIADNASLSITDDIALEAYVKLTSLPATNAIQTLISKWNENSNQRSYKMDITTSSNFFGDGSDGALTISSDTVQAPIDSACSGTIGSTSLTATNTSFAAGQEILIIQMMGTNVGLYQRTSIQSYTAGTITTTDVLSFTSSSTGNNKAQVIVLPKYTNITVNSGKYWRCKSWNGTTGGILAFLANGTLSGPGTIDVSYRGYRGATVAKYQGEGSVGPGTLSRSANGNSGGGATDAYGNANAGGGGGSSATPGYDGSQGQNQGGLGGRPGSIVGSSDLSTLLMGGSGGAGGGSGFGAGGNGSGCVYGIAYSIDSTITFTAAGQVGYTTTGSGGSGGSGAGGSVLLYSHTPELGTASTALGAYYSGSGPGGGGSGGFGGNGRFAVYYVTTPTGTTNPTFTGVEDTTLSNTTGYILRLLLSSNGTNSEIYSTDITSYAVTGVWNRYQVSWDASTSTASFYVNGTLLSERTGAFTAIYNSTARFALATSYDSSGNPTNFFDGRMDDVRVWNATRDITNFVLYNDRVMSGVETNLSAYYKLDGNVNDSQTYTATSNLTATNTPTYSADVPFSGLTTRADQDVNINATGSTYTLGTALSEGAVDRQTFTPTKEPIKSVMLNINTVGTGNWTVVIHDGLNREVASLTVANAQLHTGLYEFVFASSFRPILTADYHIHVYSTVGDGKIVTSGLNDMEGTATPNTGAYLATFFQILVDDQYHPMTQFLNFIVVGNERYVAKLEAGSIYNPHQLVLPAGYRVRCFAKWNEYLAIGVWKGTSITDTDQGKIFIWDGSNDAGNNSTVNAIVDVLEGGINAMQGAAGRLHVVAGYKGKLLEYSGGETTKVTQVPNLGLQEYCETAPGAMCLWQSLLRIGSTLNTDSSTVHQGVYSYGKLNTNYPSSLGFEYPLSVGDQTSSSTKIGCLLPSGQKLFVGWQNGTVYGIDAIDTNNDVYDTATIELLVADLKRLTQMKLPLVFRADFEPLLDGQSYTLKYKADREASWKTLETQDTVGTTEVRGIVNQQCKEVQFAVDIVTGGTTTVTTGLTLEIEDSKNTIDV